jgi:glyoxylase-like metal-dependent hydrolase (beta-lactamase superfamily II)
MDNNAYFLGEEGGGDAVVIDPTFESGILLSAAQEKGWSLRQIWLTHGHFDHIAGAGEIAQAFTPHLPIALHPADEDWYQHTGGAAQFGLNIAQPPDPTIHFKHGMSLQLDPAGPAVATVLHAPGHSPGHVMFYCESLGVLFCGDVIFRMGIGRTDLPGGDMAALQETIRSQVFTLPDETRLLPGHGPESTVGFEKKHNPFLQG